MRLSVGLSAGLHLSVLLGSVSIPLPLLAPLAIVGAVGALPSMLTLLGPILGKTSDPLSQLKLTVRMHLAPWKLVPLWTVVFHVAMIYSAILMFPVFEPVLRAAIESVRHGMAVQPLAPSFDGPVPQRAFSAGAMAYCLGALTLERMAAKVAESSASRVT